MINVLEINCGLIPNSTFDEDQLIGMVLDMYNAGIHTLMSTMKWCMLYLAVNPDCQDKVRQCATFIFGRC